VRSLGKAAADAVRSFRKLLGDFELDASQAAVGDTTLAMEEDTHLLARPRCPLCALFEEKGTEDCCRRGRVPFEYTTSGAPPEEDDDGEEEEGKDSLDGFAVSSSSKEKDAKAQASLNDQREMLEETLTKLQHI
jgi:hypothetical protein